MFITPPSQLESHVILMAMKRPLALADRWPIILTAFLAGLLILSGCGPASPGPVGDRGLIAEGALIGPDGRTLADQRPPGQLVWLVCFFPRD